jgi:hypothetical protein
MKIWDLLVNIILWPGRRVITLIPELGEEERRLAHNVVNYVVWLTIICAVLGYYMVKYILPVAP